MTRRNFVWSFFALLSANVCGQAKSLPYQVRFLVDLQKHSEDDFFVLQRKYEDNDAIDRLTSDFEKRGWIIGKRDFKKSDRHLIWTYRFKNKEYSESSCPLP